MLERSSSKFDLASVEAAAKETRFSGRIFHFEVVESTNELAVRAADAGSCESVWVANVQTAGRGRGSHSWHSAGEEGLYVSMLVLPQIPMSYAVDLPLASGLAVQAAVRESTGIVLDLRWPNDLMLGGLKVGGILVESASSAAPAHWQAGVGIKLRYAVIGVGLNLNHTSFPPALQATASSLRLQTGGFYNRESILGALLHHTEHEVTRLYRSWVGTDNGLTVRARFAEGSSWVAGRRVRVGERDGYTGVTQGLDERGFLRVLTDDGTMQTVISGGVREA